MSNRLHPTNDSLIEAYELSETILRSIEYSEISLTNVALMTSRLARLLNDFDHQKIMEYEAGGYPSENGMIPPEPWRLIGITGRKFTMKDQESNEMSEYAYLESILSLEEELRIAQASLDAARDPDRSVSSSNPNQYVFNPSSNAYERATIRQRVSTSVNRLSSRRSYIYNYVLQKNLELKYSGIVDDIFSRVRRRVDQAIGMNIPEAVKRLSAAYLNLQSNNDEDWSNAVHSCRRILQDLADALYPPHEDKVIMHEGKKKSIKLGSDNYINRIIAYVEENSESGSYTSIVGSQLDYLGDRLDAIFAATQKGSHSTIIEREEADRYVIYTYLIVGDILSLEESNK